MDGGSGGPKSEGTRCGSLGGKSPVAGTNGRAKCARSSMGRRVLILVLVSAFQGRGPVRGFLHLAGLRDSEVLNG